MTSYIVERTLSGNDSGELFTEEVSAAEVEIQDGGVLAFYGEVSEEQENTLRAVAGDRELIVAYSEWDAFSKQ